ncbi:DUF58 domain-containing protein [Paludisphaera rhizosphaerae]|uniref:DUF58 domain-containing protein n=1 Tax=Paludisphaera rhizosphaerae TaxID=2711216 RepID=UPI0013EB5AD6|nr:DUF58 domain-containing protein [Paludisphaera rhizosphaerae]
MRSRAISIAKRLRSPASVLATAAVAGVLCGLYLHPRALVPAAGIAAVLVVGAVWPWVSLWGVTGELSYAVERTREGSPTSARLRIRNRAPWGAWALVVRPSSGESFGPLTGLAFSPGLRTTEAAWDVVFDRRGRYPETVPRVACGFPFGIREASRPILAARCILVWPATFPVGPIPESAGARESEGTAIRARAGTIGDLVGVRPYRRGDSIRRIHWPQSARHGTLIVCELESRATPEVQIVIDVHPDSHAGSGSAGSLEWAVRVAASFAEDWIGQGVEVELVFGDVTITSKGGSVDSRRRAALDALACLTADASQSLERVLAGPACVRRTSGLRLVVATDRSPRRPHPGSPRLEERFVLLAAGAFADAPAPVVAPSGPRAWIWIDDPRDVPRQVRRGWKGGALEA